MQKMNKVTYIVGQRIKQQFNGISEVNLVTFGEFIDNHESQLNNLNDTEFKIGQGLSKANIDKIFKLAKGYLKNSYDNLPIIDNSVTHKHHIYNTMISVPHKLNENLYCSYLFIDEHCNEMRDHLTGYHIQGMVLIEAARQMVNAVTEEFLIDQANHYALVLKGLKADFLSYTFPFEVKLICKVLNIKHGFRGSFNAEVQINFIQNAIETLCVTIVCQVLEKKIVGNYELSYAQKIFS